MTDPIVTEHEDGFLEFAESQPPVTSVNRAEAGQPGNIQRSSWYDPTFGPAQWESEPDEPNLDLQFPFSTAVYDAMARTDPQVGSLYRAITLSIRRAKWTLITGREDDEPKGPPPAAAAPQFPTPPPAPGDTPPVTPTPPAGAVPNPAARRFADSTSQTVSVEVEDFVRTEIGLNRPGESLPDNRTSKVLFRRHLLEALTMLFQGFSCFEQVYQVDIDDTGKSVFHLHKLASRPQKTIEHLLVEADGDLKAVVQKPLPLRDNSYAGIIMPIETLVFYCHERVGADWAGTSILRNSYKNWLVKDVVLRIAAQIIERNGMGIPDVTYTENGTTSQMQALEWARKMRAGSTAGIAHPQDVKVQLLGVTGNLVDPLPFLTYNDQQIAGSALAMFQTLGHDNGARNLGDTFLDIFTNSLQAEADNFCDEFTEQVIKPLCAANFPGQPYPRLSAGELTASGILDAKSLNELVAAGLLTPDSTLEAFLRTRYDLPDAYQPTEAGSAVIPTPDGPPYDGADPNAPIEQRVNQPPQGIAGIPTSRPAAVRPTLPLKPPGGILSERPGIASYAEFLAARRDALAAESMLV